MPNDSALRDQLVKMLKEGQAHATFDQTIEDFPLAKIGIRPAGLPHSAWELLEHLRIAQNDIVEFSRSAKHVSPKFPDGYWPLAPAPEGVEQWNATAQAFREDLEEFEKLLRDPKRDLHEPFAWGEGQTLLREALLIADHNAYHLGQLMLVRRALGDWPASK